MNNTNSDRLIQSLAHLLAAQPPEGASRYDAAQIERVLRVYYRHIPPDDLAGHAAEDLLGALIAHWQLMRRRMPEEARVRVYNPDFERDGWRSRDTVVEIVAQDMPFLVDSVTWALNRRGLTLRLTLHPVFSVSRDSTGLLTALRDAGGAGPPGVEEAVIRLHVDRQPPETLAGLAADAEAVVADVRAATGDWVKMRRQVERLRDEIDGPCDRVDIEEAHAFLNWMVNDHFLFLACCTLVAGSDGAADRLLLEDGSALGLLRESGAARADRWIADLASDIVESGSELMVTKAGVRSTVHRPAYMDLVAIKRRDAQGRVDGLHCIFGLFSSSAYHTPPRQIPLLRRKVDAVFAAARATPNSHSGRAIGNILDNFPRDTLFQIGDDELLATTLGVLGLQERQRTRLFIVRDPFHRFYSCLVYLPRERYSREVRVAVQAILVEALHGTDVVFETHFSESILARIYYVVITPGGEPPGYDIDELEARVVEAATTWQDGLREALFEQVDEAAAVRLLAQYAQAFPGGYREDYHPRIAVNDIQRIEALRGQVGLGVHLYQPIIEAVDRVHVRLYALTEPVPLSRAIPVLEHMGLVVLGERPYRIRLDDSDIWIHDFSTRRPRATGPVTALMHEHFTAAFLAAWEGRADDDGFNGLVLRAGLSWREALVFRAYARYLRQVKVPYTEAYMVAVLNRHPVVVQLLGEMFAIRFDPDHADAATRSQAFEAALARFESLLEAVDSLDDDNILRRFLNLMQATLRTNYFQHDDDGAAKPSLSFKFDSRRVDGIPQPPPMFEIFVYAVHMEGVHLRGGRVARGGLRWSDRMEDYRTEILGLMKAQMVKNTVIVPVGSKGGFVVKNARAGDSREQRLEKGIAAYRSLLSGMLDLTDNRVGDQVVVPPRLVRHDDDDPYLVIAADKGTATFSDIANGVSAGYGFWLGDAFASGGSAGYDHKAMGITARGAWESVKRNFRELGTDIQQTDFTVAGIGDMSGDVFGNGMLLSRHIRLVAAFNHQHIFLDPEPDAARSFAERERLFHLPRSGWSDYDRQLISAGGGIYARSAKSIAVSPEAQRLLGIRAERLAPSELIRAILRAPVDLLWNGGIGTYVKASSESHEQARDKANDALRVDAAELRCKVVGEGGNLGLTQLARVEFALAGGRLYTDAIDNSAGVDCSDHEVNIKILLDRVVADGDLTLKQRNELLTEMTSDVAALVLADNYAQTQAISLVVADAAERLYEHARFIELLEQRGTLDRRLEGLPDRKALTERLAQGLGLTKPEVAVLLAYSKMNYSDTLVASDIPDDPFVLDRLVGYFPPALRERFAAQIATHRLRREIIATVIAGSIADHVGPGIGFRVREEVGSDLAGVARAYLVVSEIFDTDALWARVEALDNQVAAAVQIDMLGSIAWFLEQVLTALLRSYRDHLDMTALTARFRDGARELWQAMPKPLASHEKAEFDRRVRRLGGAGVPRELAVTIAGLQPMAASLDIVEVADETAADVAATAWIYSALSHTLELNWIDDRLDELPVQTHWHLLARTKLQATLRAHRRGLTAAVLHTRGRERTPRGMLEHWVRSNRDMLDRHARGIAEFKAGQVFDFAIQSLMVARVGELLPALRVQSMSREVGH